MTDERSPLEVALDLFVYAPLGLAATAAEQFPKLAVKGRAQVEGRITVARMVGQLAVAHGRKEVERRLGQAARAPASPNGVTGSGDGGSRGRPAGPTTGLRRVEPAEKVEDRWPHDPEDPVAAGPAGAESSPAGDLLGHGSGLDAAALAIPGYDSLSASQVVQRLAGLSRPELAAVGEYEAAHRARRTVLTRISQLQGS
jgi:hypothetical protein